MRSCGPLDDDLLKKRPVIRSHVITNHSSDPLWACPHQYICELLPVRNGRRPSIDGWSLIEIQSIAIRSTLSLGRHHIEITIGVEISHLDIERTIIYRRDRATNKGQEAATVVSEHPLGTSDGTDHHIEVTIVVIVEKLGVIVIDIRI
ncbi:MAG: hypothetical protein DSY92_02630 [Planctomycetota bacterium]|nr:MAG: hypothetical protein DSY92_02630 [Planctomycetota bacterium]